MEQSRDSRFRGNERKECRCNEDYFGVSPASFAAAAERAYSVLM